MHRPQHFQPPASKIFITFQLINVKNRRHIVNYQFNLAAIWLVYGWLVEFWCTRSRDSAPLIKSRNFYGTSSEHSFYSQKVKKNKYKKSPSHIFF